MKISPAITALIMSLISTSGLSAVAVKTPYVILGESADASGISGYDGSLMKVNVGEYAYEEVVREAIPGVLGSELTETHTIYMGMTKVTWYEKSDKPCKIKAYAVSLEPTIGKSNNKTKDICTGSSGDTKTVSIAGVRKYVRGIAACTTNKQSSSKDRLKGIRLYTAEVSTTGKVTNLNTYEETEHFNCSQWFSPVYCPTGYVATGLKVYHNGDFFRGLGLKCRLVELSTSPYK